MEIFYACSVPVIIISKLKLATPSMLGDKRKKSQL
jgi:hypothetical protein